MVCNALLVLNISMPVLKNCALWWYMDVTIYTINCYFESKPAAGVLCMTSVWLTSLYIFTVMPEMSYKMKRLQYGTSSDVLNSCFLEFPNIFTFCVGGGVYYCWFHCYWLMWRLLVRHLVNVITMNVCITFH